LTTLATIDVQPGTFLAIVAAAAAAATLGTVIAGRGVVIPVVVIELLFGVLLGPSILGLHANAVVVFFSDIGLGLLFFFAGYEIDLGLIRGRPLRLGVVGWTLSLALAFTLGGILAAAGVVLSLLYTGSAMATTALGTLVPILSDAGELRTRVGVNLMAAGAVGEFGPILILTLFLSASGTVHNALILVAFVALAVAVAVFTVRSASRTLPLFARTIESSAQLAVRWIVVLVFALVYVAYELGLDLLLGGFAAGLITRQLLNTQELPAFDSKLTAIAFGLFVPFFFVTSGLTLDVSALFGSVSAVLKMFLFLILFLVVRGTPALVLYRRALDARERVILALMCSTQLPLVLAITEVSVQTGHMRPSTAAALVGAAVLSTLFFPMLSLRLLDARREAPAPAAAGAV